MGNFVKFLMFVANVAYWVMGAALLGITIYLSVDSGSQSMATITGAAGMNKDIYWAAVYMLMTMGCLVILAGFAGCFGALKAPDSDRILHSYFGFVKFIILCEIVILILIGVYWNEFNSDIANKMEDQVKSNYSVNTGLTNAWDNMQKNWKCCGSYNFTDYILSAFNTDNPTLRVPLTCCVRQSGEYIPCQAFNLNNNTINQAGCYGKLKNVVDDNSTLVIVITCVFAGLEVFGSICACLLIRRK